MNHQLSYPLPLTPAPSKILFSVSTPFINTKILRSQRGRGCCVDLFVLSHFDIHVNVNVHVKCSK